MPIHEYRCESCSHELDALQKLSDAPLRDCPNCAAPALRRLISAPSFRLKGNGWYETDFKSEKETKRNLVEKPGDSKEEKGIKKTNNDAKSSGDKPSKKDVSDLSSGTKTKSKSSGPAAA
jgi:putative FmdB family regulatory protein|tara:strand:- start:831 stop:1190 length:360 start_codon:yes stop_codon:yes gene_type:complete